MTFHFAYGSNMSRAAMHGRCSGAVALGTAGLSGWRFVINTDGYASIAPHRGSLVNGVLWKLTPRDLAALNIYENVDGGLYRRERVMVRCGRALRPALAYVGRGGEGRPRPGYIELVARAAREWDFPPDYIRALERWSVSGLRGARAVESGECR